MGILLLLVGLLGVTSGAVKIRARVRSTIGLLPMGIAEWLIGTVAVVGSAVGLSAIRPVAWTVVVLTIGLIFTSTFVHVRRVGHYMKKREQAEALRLKTYLLTHEEDSTSS